MGTTGDGPLARSNNLFVEELGDEILVYDTNAERGHSLSPEAARVWRSCDGGTSAEELSARLGLEPDTVDRALGELSDCELLEERPTIAADGSTRREATLRLAKVGAAAAAAPLILSVAAASAQTTTSPGVCAAQTNCATCFTVGCCCCKQPNGNFRACVATNGTCPSGSTIDCTPP